MKFLRPFGGITRREVQIESIRQQLGEDSMSHESGKYHQK
jgi:hypothetical protein